MQVWQLSQRPRREAHEASRAQGPLCTGGVSWDDMHVSSSSYEMHVSSSSRAGGASWDEPLSIISTLYKAEGQGFREKAAKFVLRGLNDSTSTSSGTALASGKIDLAVIPFTCPVLEFERARTDSFDTPRRR